MPQATATIFGAGSIGMAIATVLSENKYKVCFWDIDKDVVNSINLTHKNPRSMQNVVLDKSIKAFVDIKKASMNADLAVFAVPSFAVRDVAKQIFDSIPRNCVIACFSKGLEKEIFKTMEQVIREELGGQFADQISVVSGPMLAHDIIKKSPTAGMLASRKSNAYSKRSLEAFQNKWFKLVETRDVEGVCFSAVAKHLMAVTTGILFGLGYSSNTNAWVLTELFRETSRLVWKLGGKEETIYSLAGFGDMIGTSFSDTSRNRRFGELLGDGKTVTKALSVIKETVEGIDAVESLAILSKKEKLKLPVLEALYQVVCEKKNTEKIFKEMISNL